MARIAPMTAAPPAMSSFILSMPSAGLIEMPPVSNVMPLPTRPRTGVAGAPGGSWRMTITRGGSALPARDAQQEAHAEPRDLVLVEDLDGEPRVPGDRRGALREDRRREDVARLVAELARDVGGLAEDAAALHRALERRSGGGAWRDDNQHLLRGRASTILALVAIAAEPGEQQPFGNHLHRVGRVDTLVSERAVDKRDPRDVTLPGSQRRGGGEPAEALETEVERRTRADQRDARRAPPLYGRGQEELVWLALKLPRGERTIDRSSRGFGESGNGLENLLAFEKRKNNEISLDIGRSRRHETYRVAECGPNHRSIIR